MKWRARFRKRLRNAVLGWRRPDGAFVPERYAPRYNSNAASGWDRELNFQRNEEVLVMHIPVTRELLSLGRKSAVVATVAAEARRMALLATRSRVELGC